MPDPARPLRRAPRPDPPVVCPGFGFDRWGFACSCFWGNVQVTCLRCFRRYGGGLPSRQTVLLAPRSARPCPATPPFAPTRPARGMFGFWTRQVIFPLSRVHMDVQDSCPGYPGGLQGQLAFEPPDRSAFSCAPPPCRASRRPEPTVVCSGLYLTDISRTSLPSRRVSKNKERRRSTGQQPGTKSSSRPADELLINCR